MSLTINHNITSLNAWRNLSQTDRATGRSMEKLSSGLRINRAADDPAGLVISEKMRAQLAGLSAASKNVEKAINVVSTAEAALDKVNVLLNKMRSLAIDSANLGVNDQAMLDANQNELDEAIDSVSRIAQYTQFGTKKLLDGSVDGTVFQVGANESQSVSLTIEDVNADALATTGVTYTQADGTSGVAVSTDFTSLESLKSGTGGAYTNGVFAETSAARDTAALDGYTSIADDIAQSIAIIDKAIEEVSSIRGKLGAVQADNLEVNLDSLRVSYENLQAAESTIRDTDMTQEMAQFTKYQIMMQAGTAMLAQANQLPNNVLQLLR
jgi:flagellin